MYAVVTVSNENDGVMLQFHRACMSEQVFTHHLLWRKIESTLAEGAILPWNPIDNQDHGVDKAFMVDHGNHKSTQKYDDEFLAMIESEVC
jgi:hypothetical protein